MSETSGREERMVVTSDENRRLDALAVLHGVGEDALVESAGRAAAAWILDHASVRRVLLLVGPGGNGADALVVARCLRQSRVEVQAFRVAAARSSPRVDRALLALQNDGGGVASVDSGDLAPVEQALAACDLVIDGLYGSGLARPLEGVAARLVGLVNGSRKRVIALDIPSGVAADAGEVPGPAVRADITLAMEFLKPAHLLFPAAGLRGNVSVVPVAYPAETLGAARPWARVLERGGVARRLPTRPPTGHKGTFGHVLLVAGSAGMVGAAILAGRAALRSGAGLVTVGVAASQAAAVHAGLPEALVAPLPEEDGQLVPAALPNLEAAGRRASVLVVGPGIGRSEASGEGALAALAAFDGPAVVDADALWALARHPSALAKLAGRAILTPHPGEFARLAGGDPTEIDRDRVARAGAFAARHGVIVVLKGRPTAIGLPDGRVYLNPTGNTGLATGGSGDVLAGAIGGLVATGASLEDAALVGPYVHGLAAELFAIRGAEASLLPSDVIDLWPRALWEVCACA